MIISTFQTLNKIIVCKGAFTNRFCTLNVILKLRGVFFFFFFFFFFKGHKLNSLMANMKSSYRIHEHNSDNNDNKINFDK